MYKLLYFEYYDELKIQIYLIIPHILLLILLEFIKLFNCFRKCIPFCDGNEF